MPIFSCSNCGTAITVAESDAARDVVCSNCNTRQAFPAETLPKAVLPTRSVPDYVLASFTSGALQLVGVLGIILGALNLFVAPPVAISVIVGGLMCLGVGQILDFVRLIARQTYTSALDR